MYQFTSHTSTLYSLPSSFANILCKLWNWRNEEEVLGVICMIILYKAYSYQMMKEMAKTLQRITFRVSSISSQKRATQKY